MNYERCIRNKCKECKEYIKCFREEDMKIKFLVDVPDKYTKEQYKKGQVKEFEDNRAKEILSAKRSNGQAYAEEVKEIKKEAEEENKAVVTDKSKKTRKKK